MCFQVKDHFQPIPLTEIFFPFFLFFLFLFLSLFPPFQWLSRHTCLPAVYSSWASATVLASRLTKGSRKNLFFTLSLSLSLSQSLTNSKYIKYQFLFCRVCSWEKNNNLRIKRHCILCNSMIRIKCTRYPYPSGQGWGIRTKWQEKGFQRTDLFTDTMPRDTNLKRRGPCCNQQLPFAVFYSNCFPRINASMEIHQRMHLWRQGNEMKLKNNNNKNRRSGSDKNVNNVGTKYKMFLYW